MLNIFWNFCFCSAWQSLAILIEYFLERRSGSHAFFSQLMTKLEHFRKPPGVTLPLTRCPGLADQGQVARWFDRCCGAYLAVKSQVRATLLQYKLQTYGQTLVKRTEKPSWEVCEGEGRMKEAVSIGEKKQKTSKQKKNPKDTRKKIRVLTGEVRCRCSRLYLESKGCYSFISFLPSFLSSFY